jgi:uncharacterized protein
MLEIIIPAFLLGISGSFHCIGMCGPIILALPAHSKNQLSYTLGRVLYNFGRIVTYTLMGLLIGILSNQLSLIGIQQFISIFLGVVIILYYLIPNKLKSEIIGINFVEKLTSPIKRGISKLFSIKNNFGMFLIGILNGLLPCGFVYLGIAGALSLGVKFESAVFMFFFGLGTFPAMFAASFGSKYFTAKIRNKINRFIPYLAILFALILILRGLNIGIPLLSPHFEHKHNTETVSACCN